MPGEPAEELVRLEEMIERMAASKGPLPIEPADSSVRADRRVFAAVLEAAGWTCTPTDEAAQSPEG